MSISAAMHPLRTASIILPESLTTMQSTVSCHTNFPVSMHRDSGSKELLPTTTFYSNLAIYMEFFLF